jgi:voltage-gated potassium channel
VVIAAVRRNDDVMIPRGDLVLKENDIVVIGAVDPERSEHVALREITLKSRNPWNGHEIRDLDISRKTVIVMVKRAGRTLIPKGDLKLQDGDRVFLYSKAQIPDSRQHFV